MRETCTQQEAVQPGHPQGAITSHPELGVPSGDHVNRPSMETLADPGIHGARDAMRRSHRSKDPHARPRDGLTPQRKTGVGGPPGSPDDATPTFNGVTDKDGVTCRKGLPLAKRGSALLKRHDQPDLENTPPPLPLPLWDDNKYM